MKYEDIDLDEAECIIANLIYEVRQLSMSMAADGVWLILKVDMIRI